MNEVTPPTTFDRPTKLGRPSRRSRRRPFWRWPSVCPIDLVSRRHRAATGPTHPVVSPNYGPAVSASGIRKIPLMKLLHERRSM